MSIGMNRATQLRGNTGSAGRPTGSSMREKRPHGYQKFAMQNFTPEQMQLFQQMFGDVGPDSYLSRLAGGDEELFDEMEAPALRQFSELQGGLASRFSGMGSFGARNSSGFQNTANAAASNFAQELQANRQGLQRQAQRDIFDMSNLLLNQRPYEQGYVAKKRGNSTADLIGRLGGAVPGLVSSAMGGGSPWDALKGAASGVGSFFGF
jgi:hypothetical protein